MISHLENTQKLHSPQSTISSMAKFINPFTDWGFKHIFGREISKDLLIAFLNNLFKDEFEITQLEFKNNEQIGITADSRNIIFDIYCTTDKGEHIIVEMQNRAQENFIDRALYYSSRAIVNQGEKGNWYYELLPVYTVCFMNFVEPTIAPQKFRTDLVLADRDTKAVVSNKLRIVYLMLPLFNKEEMDCDNDFERWIFVLKNMTTLERMPFLAKNALFQKLAAISDVNALSKEEHAKYDESIKVMRDTLATHAYAMKQGLEEGLKKGLQQGIEKGLQQGLQQGTEQGIEQGIEQGAFNEKIRIATNLLAAGLSIKDVAAATGLTEEELTQIKN